MKQSKSSQASVPCNVSNIHGTLLFIFAVGLVVSLVVFYFTIKESEDRATTRNQRRSIAAKDPRTLPTVVELCNMTDVDLASVRLATLNLSCLDGLPGTDKVDRAACHRRLDLMVRAGTSISLAFTFLRFPMPRHRLFALVRLVPQPGEGCLVAPIQAVSTRPEAMVLSTSTPTPSTLKFGCTSASLTTTKSSTTMFSSAA